MQVADLFVAGKGHRVPGVGLAGGEQVREIPLQLAHLRLRPGPSPGGHRPAEMGIGGGGVAAGMGEAPRQLVRQGVERVKAPFP